MQTSLFASRLNLIITWDTNLRHKLYKDIPLRKWVTKRFLQVEVNSVTVHVSNVQEWAVESRDKLMVFH